jgi:hypothetical protein
MPKHGLEDLLPSFCTNGTLVDTRRIFRIVCSDKTINGDSGGAKPFNSTVPATKIEGNE